MSKKKSILFEAVIALVIVFLAFTVYAMISTSTTAAAIKWTTPTYDQPRYMYAGDNGILYSFTGNSIYAIDSEGRPAWNLTIPDKWSISNEWLRLKDTGDILVGGFTGTTEVSPTVASSDGVLYVYARPNITVTSTDITTVDNFTQVFAISKDGIILWSVPLESKLILYDSSSLDSVSIHASGGRVYVFHDYSETVIDSSGHVLFTIASVSDPAAVDESGRIYTVSPVSSDPLLEGGAYDYRVPSGTVNAYDASGRLLWSRDIGESVERQFLREDVRAQYDSLPLYSQGKLYLPLQDGMLSMNTDGTVNWVKRLNESARLLELMPMDSAGNFYLEHVNGANQSASSVYVLSGDGSNLSQPVPYDEYRSWNYKAGKDGILYYVSGSAAANRSLADLDTLKLTAYDLKNASALWTYTIPTYKKTTITLDATSIRNIFDPYTSSDILGGSQQRYPYGSTSAKVFGQSDVIVLPSEGRVYASYSDYNYEYPIVSGQSQCVYAMGLAAISNDGRQEWQYSTVSPVTAMAEGNGTLFYSTMDGKISAAKFDPATGLTISIITYLFIRFIAVGAVSRARSRLDKNENRNVVLKFIAEHPGSTLYEIARGIDMNLGTARYHVLILGINHRITSQKADNKYVRFFLNSNTYSKEDQVLLSFIRREPTRKVLGTLLEKPGRTNVDLSRELDIAESTISKYIKELSSKEIIMKEPLPGGRFAYSIRKEYVERVAMALESIKCAA
ncbi:MAG TPA: PQQ-binding-like beta-propeller repeat protein [Methanocella sp.]|uniref:outer membrane protein assembly factor BamB family protein n=1 Tax=Methanocella sp. TaxID=2052833 RepID=UPI002C39AA87|nr:PQQ-binding-like beta-propeller repeat protein [Methanocella sp.]HTY90017.1 PQQ-binding-like beta-propeller repeat protein [Methanocella sp.]